MNDIIEKFNHKIEIGTGSSTGHPDHKGMQTCDIVTWYKFDDNPWFRPYGRFSRWQIIAMINLCERESQLVSLFELLSAEKSG